MNLLVNGIDKVTVSVAESKESIILPRMRIERNGVKFVPIEMPTFPLKPGAGKFTVHFLIFSPKSEL